MPAKGTGHEYHFANLSFRLRETTTFEKKWALCKIWSRRNISHKNFGRTSGEALSQPGRGNGPSSHFLFAHLCGKITHHFLPRKPRACRGAPSGAPVLSPGAEPQGQAGDELKPRDLDQPLKHLRVVPRFNEASTKPCSTENINFTSQID